MPAPVVAAGAARAGAARAGAGSAARRRAGTAAAGNPGLVEKQRAAIQAIKDARPPSMDDQPKPKPAPVVDEHQDDDAGESSRTGERRRPQLPHITVNTRGGAGGGFVLGMLAYVVGLTYLRGGKPAVKQLLRAKFLNDVTP